MHVYVVLSYTFERLIFRIFLTVSVNGIDYHICSTYV